MTIIDKNATPSTDRIADALAAIKGGPVSTEIADTFVDDEPEDEVGVIGGSVTDSVFGSDESNDSEENSTSNSPTTQDAKAIQNGVEEVIVKGPDGKKTTISVDYNDRDQILKNAKLAAGARKWQAERDRALAQVESSKVHAEHANHFNVLSEAYDNAGPLGVISAMLGEDGAKQWLEQQFQRYEMRQTATPDELKYLDAQERAEAQARELEAIKRKQADWEKKMSEEKSSADLASLQSTINPVFDKYRFAGKLGDPNQEHDLDEVVWARAMKNLQQFEKRGVQITRELADRAFRTASNSLRKVVNVQAEKAADQKIARTKERALETAQIRAKRGQASTAESDSAKEMLKRGDISSFFKTFGKNIKI
jgi:hypothetical protein